MVRRFPEIPLHLSSKSKPSCQTLPNALEISKNTTRVSSEFSKASYILEVIENIVESPGLKPDWLFDIKLLLLKNA